jgi:ribosomal protein S18 acetylase RimI-like enzyme
VCCGGWRRHDDATIADVDRGVLRPGDAEIKRMWVDPAHRRRGLATAVLAELERAAAAAHCERTVLETGSAQPEAIAFYAARGYTEMPGFGVYRDAPGSICFARELRPGGHGVRDAGR